MESGERKGKGREREKERYTTRHENKQIDIETDKQTHTYAERGGMDRLSVLFIYLRYWQWE